MKTHYDKIFIQFFSGHMAKMAATHIYGKNLPSPEQDSSIADVGLTKFAQMMILG